MRKRYPADDEERRVLSLNGPQTYERLRRLARWITAPGTMAQVDLRDARWWLRQLQSAMRRQRWMAKQKKERETDAK